MRGKADMANQSFRDRLLHGIHAAAGTGRDIEKLGSVDAVDVEIINKGHVHARHAVVQRLAELDRRRHWDRSWW